ncbi:hypothetical protein [Dictyobacter vulcani]|uniref:hypothetical protein n=1 Tax=Dictyobacter vulcani TaxID=2607529 RepID=UPI0013874369|nr:hypothetical protein [Dictyobacter vulcani]
MRGHLALRQGAGRPLHPRLQRELESPVLKSNRERHSIVASEIATTQQWKADQ